MIKNKLDFLTPEADATYLMQLDQWVVTNLLV